MSKDTLKDNVETVDKEAEISIIGNPNVGKTSLFNLLTGTKQYVANWPGVTVEKKIGSFKYKGKTFKLVDLPGVYTLSAKSEDERVAKDYLISNTSEIVIVVADALNLESSMFLLFQLIEIGVKTILVINSVDEAREKGRIIDPSPISKTLNIPVILTSAKTGEGKEELLEEAYKLSKEKNLTKKKIMYPEEIENFINFFQDKVSKYPKISSKYQNYIDSSWLPIYFLEFGSEDLELPQDFLTELKENFDIEDLKNKYLNWKFNFISYLVSSSIIKEGIDWSLRDILDHVFTHKILGILIYVFALFAVFSLTFSLAQPLSDLLDSAFTFLGNSISEFVTIPWLESLLVDGVIAGVGGVLVFIPQIFILFFFLGFLEESGYLPRAAFLVDRIARNFGLSGRSFMSIILGFGCNVPAIISTKTIANKKERLALILSLPFASCSARLPVYILLISAFFSTHAATIMLLVYLSSIALVLISSKFLQRFITQSEDIPFIIELPRFRMPTLKNLSIYTWNRGKHFLQKAGGIILIATVLIWLLSFFPNFGTDINSSFAASIGRVFEPLTNHLGWDWRINTGLIFGVAAKEIVVSSYATIFNVGEGSLTYALQNALTPASALALIFFVMAYIPCFATLATIKAETNGWKWAIFSFIYTTVVAYLIANLVFFVGGIFL
ncbi:iron transporter [Petrotoga miotherma DSM 10691]|uniref:Ferrous iron transport protein B n=1 Tax=Petrotoga miotherma DSM 10691 TaxID=1434326 RepID=A0A2K1PGL8_9BACT|nr:MULTISPECIES: ferrous iron transport protein B [Petrotoga]MBL5980715.1 iron transporter [Petrotoga sp. 8T1HF07.NaAc.6.1]PNR93497.1 iron transporter [Petrotoga sp. HWHPT.55.6.3]PNS01951.1 iron transporter [Petrotoga miotherma DSM 10691]RPD36293.1 iron transporter [Petrotoga sp. HWH.PT.55.6.1]